MSAQRDRSEEGLILRLVSQYIAREANRSTLITPTRVVLSRARTKATVYVSIFPDIDTSNALEFLQRHRGNLFNYLKKESRLSPIPGIQFEFDTGEQNRQHLDELSKEINDKENNLTEGDETSTQM